MYQISPIRGEGRNLCKGGSRQTNTFRIIKCRDECVSMVMVCSPPHPAPDQPPIPSPITYIHSQHDTLRRSSLSFFLFPPSADPVPGAPITPPGFPPTGLCMPAGGRAGLPGPRCQATTKPGPWDVPFPAHSGVGVRHPPNHLMKKHTAVLLLITRYAFKRKKKNPRLPCCQLFLGKFIFSPVFYKWYGPLQHLRARVE